VNDDGGNERAREKSATSVGYEGSEEGKEGLTKSRVGKARRILQKGVH